MHPVEAHQARTAMVILTCARCGRGVKVFGKVSRVLCACGQILFHREPPSSDGAPRRAAGRKNPLGVVPSSD